MPRAKEEDGVVLELNDHGTSTSGFQRGCRCRCCRDAYYLYHRPYAHAHGRKRWQMIAEIKLAEGCTDCGYREHPAALDFDHVRGEKKFTIGANPRGSWTSLQEEIAKCEVVCANCHRIRTQTRRRAM